jgi:hypothetical protein
MKTSPIAPAIAAFLLTGLLAGAVHAEVGAPRRMERAAGVVTALTDSAITLKEAGGKTETIALLPDWTVSVSKPISVEEIQPGSYLGTTNHPTSSGTGISTEVHVSPPGRSGPGVDFVMDAAANTTMTNGVVSTVVKANGGRQLTVNYGPGVRTVTVPRGVPVVLNSPGERSMVKVGHTVRVITYQAADGTAPHQSITVGVNGAAPPT